MSSINTETRPIETPVPSRYDSVPGMKEAVQEVTQRRDDAGTPEPQLHVSEQPTGYEGDGAVNETRKPLNATDAGRELSDWRRKRDAQAKQFERDVMGTEAEDDQTVEQARAMVEDFQQQHPAEWEQALAQERDRLAEQEQRARQLNDQAAAKLAEYETQTVSNSRQNLNSLGEAYKADFFSKYPEWADKQSLGYVAQNDPGRYAEMREAAQLYEQSYAAEIGRQTVIEQGARQRFAEAAKAEDARFEAAHPELASNPKAKQAIADEVMSYLQEQGLTKEQIMEGWNGVGPLAQIRTAVGQELLVAKARERLARKSLKASRALPPVRRPQMPGAANEPVGRRQADIMNADAALGRSASVRDAAKLVAATRRARR